MYPDNQGLEEVLKKRESCSNCAETVKILEFIGMPQVLILDHCLSLPFFWDAKNSGEIKVNELMFY